jgi:hypothetical protein
MEATDKTLKQPAESTGDIKEIDMRYAKNLRNEICKVMDKDEESFERKIASIPSGAIVVLIAYVISKDSGFIYMPIGIAAACLLLLCIISNMLSYRIGHETNSKFFCALGEYISHPYPLDLYGTLDKINKRIDLKNWLSVICMSVGIILEGIFIFINM